MLAAMFSGRHKLDKDKHGYYFVDSNGTYFGYILDYLRHDTLPPTELSLSVYKEACYYNISSLVEKLQGTPGVSRMMVKEAHRAQFPNYYELKQKVLHAAMENASIDRQGEVIIYAFRKEFQPRAQFFNINHECVADGANLNVGPWESAADEEALIRCLEADFLEDGFDMKPREQKKRCKYYNGQNCQKSVYRLTFLFCWQICSEDVPNNNESSYDVFVASVDEANVHGAAPDLLWECCDVPAAWVEWNEYHGAMLAPHGHSKYFSRHVVWVTSVTHTTCLGKYFEWLYCPLFPYECIATILLHQWCQSKAMTLDLNYQWESILSQTILTNF